MGSQITLDQFRSVFRSGGFQSVGLQASGGEFFITARQRSGGKVTLATTHGLRVRAFRDADKAIGILHQMGARDIHVDTSKWSSDENPRGRSRRPDTSIRQKRAHQAAAHDAWFRSEVERAIREADSPDAKWVSNEEVKRRSALIRADWREKSGAKKAAS